MDCYFPSSSNEADSKTVGQDLIKDDTGPTSCSSISWWLSNQRRVKRPYRAYFFSPVIMPTVERKEFDHAEEVRHKWFIVPWLGMLIDALAAWEEADQIGTVKRQKGRLQEKVKIRPCMLPPLLQIYSSSKITDPTFERWSKVEKESCALALKVEPIHIFELFSSWILCHKMTFWKPNFS